MSFTRVINLYSSERRNNGQSPYIRIKITEPTEELLEKKITDLRKSQKEINNKYKQSLREKKIMQEIESTPLQRFNNLKKQKVIDNILNMNIEYIPDVNMQIKKNTGTTGAFLASSKSGKSYLLVHMLNKYYDNRDYISTLFSINSNCKAYNELKKNILRCNKFNDECESLIQKQHYINNELSAKKSYRFVNIFDDVLDVKRNKLIKNMILTYRNSNLSCYLVLQYPFLLDKCLRANINNIFLGKFNSYECVLDIVKIYLKPFFRKILGPNANLDDMCDLYNKVTENYGFIHLIPGKNEIHFIRIN